MEGKRNAGKSESSQPTTVANQPAKTQRKNKEDEERTKEVRAGEISKRRKKKER